MRVIIAAAGTAGHINPGLAIANKIKKEENKKAEFNVATKTQPLHGSNLFACVDAVLAVELIDTSAGSGCFLLACVE